MDKMERLTEEKITIHICIPAEVRVSNTVSKRNSNFGFLCDALAFLGQRFSVGAQDTGSPWGFIRTLGRSVYSVKNIMLLFLQ